MTATIVPLRPRADRRLRQGHPWVFANELAVPARELPEGGAVDIVDAGGAFVGRGYANPHSLIAVRLLTRDRADDIDDPAFYARRLRAAVALREAVLPGRRSLRLVHAEGDGLPGLVIDRYEDVVAVQLTTLGLDRRRAALEVAVREVLAPRGAVLRNDGRPRVLEGLPEERGVWFGDVPDEVAIDEGGVTLLVSPLGGQKTGHFFDHAVNRAHAASVCRGRRVLDVYAHHGAWALHALVAGATHATVVDRSQEAIAHAHRNAARNGVTVDGVVGDAREVMHDLAARQARFDAVFLDPPAFAKSKKAATSALKGYRDVNVAALRLLGPGGLLFTASCSYHIQEDRFLETVHEAVLRAGRTARIVRRGEQGPDHPVDPAIPETRYLKCYALWVD